MWVQNILEIHSDNSEVLFFVENNKKIKNKCTKNEKVLSQLSFEQTVPINFQDSKQKWKTEQYKQWGCLGVHKDSSVKFLNINHALYKFRTGEFAPIIWLIKVSKLEKYKNINIIKRNSINTKKFIKKFSNKGKINLGKPYSGWSSFVNQNPNKVKS